jgi:acyl phosphate:glycerol-3-phosphate acyltransferase
MLALALAAAYLFGSFPTGVVLSRFVVGDDIRGHGSGNPGASNVARTFGMVMGSLVGLLDILKGLVPILIGRWLGLPSASLAAVAAVAVAGHDYSAFLRFKGGKGVATTLGAGLGLALVAGAAAMLVWVAVIASTGYSSLASLIALAVLPISIAVTGGPPAFVVSAGFLFLLAVWKHLENIYRLWNGTERKFGALKPVNGA